MPILGSTGNSSARAFGLGIPTAGGLYTFTTFTFTNAGITGRLGPTLANCLSSYNTTTNPWLSNTSFFNVVTQGIQLWTVPATGNYRILAAGAKGGGTNGGNGATIRGDFALTQGQKIRIMVGQQGSLGTDGCNQANPGMGGGGGGTFVIKETGSTVSDIFVIAGGGGGIGWVNYGSQAGTTSNSGNTSGGANGGAGGTSGNGGGTGGGCVAGGSGGAGFIGNSASSSSFTNGGAGGTSNIAGGFGGGGSTNQYCGGGGGGYSGGGGGGLSTCSCTALGSGGGGGSYNNGTNQSNTGGGNTGSVHGFVTVTLL